MFEVSRILEEADESAFWIELLIDASKTASDEASALLREANELAAIFMSSIRTARDQVIGFGVGGRL